jgi:hypothetical protein
MKNSSKLFSILLILFTGSACTASPILEDGEWEMTSQMEMSGMPAGMPSMPAMTHRQCITKDMMVPSQEHQNKDCEKMTQDVSGNTVTWSMRCTTNGQTSEMNGTSTYDGDTMKGTMQMTTQDMKMTSHVTGKRLGPCK